MRENHILETHLKEKCRQLEMMWRSSIRLHHKAMLQEDVGKGGAHRTSLTWKNTSDKSNYGHPNEAPREHDAKTKTDNRQVSQPCHPTGT